MKPLVVLTMLAATGAFSLSACTQPGTSRNAAADPPALEQTFAPADPLSHQGPASTGAPATAPTQRVTFPMPAPEAGPLWGPPGLILGDVISEQTGGAEVYAFTYTHEPLPFQGVMLHPVRTPDGTLVLHRDKERVYLHGVVSPRGGYDPLDPPLLLYNLPLEPGDRWWMPTGALTSSRVEVEIERAETVATPLGQYQTLVLAVYDAPEAGKVWEKELIRREWWVPGFGIVRRHDLRDGQILVREADIQQRAQPEPFPPMGQVAPDKPVLLLDDDQQTVRVVDLSGRELWRLDDTYWRSYYEWVREPQSEMDLLLHSAFPGSWAGVWTYNAWSYSPDQETMVPLDWVSSAGKQGSVAGQGQWVNGEFVLHDARGYPTREYRYTFNGREFYADPRHDQRIPAGSAQELLERLVGEPPLGQDDFIGAFADPTLGRKAWGLLQGLAWDPYAVVAGGPDAFTLEIGQAQFQVRVEQREGEPKIVEFSATR